MTAALAPAGAAAPKTTPNSQLPTSNVYACIAAVSAAIAKTGIGKDRTNEQQGYQFRGVDDIYNTLAPILARAGLVILPRILSRTVVERASARGGTLFCVTVEAEYDFVSAHDGSTHTARTFGEAMDSGDKATNKAMSAAYKYVTQQAFCIPTKGDNDADAHTHEPRAEPAAPVARMVPRLPASAGRLRPAAVATATPDGYDRWLLTLTATAGRGTAPLMLAWNESPLDYRRQLARTDLKGWEALKAKAAQCA